MDGTSTKCGEVTTTLQSIACGGTGGELTQVDTKDGKIVRIRPLQVRPVRRSVHRRGRPP